MPTEKQYLTIKEAASMIGVTTLTLRNWDKKGLLVAYRHPINNYRVYKLDQMQAFLQKIETDPNTPKKIKIKFEEE